MATAWKDNKVVNIVSTLADPGDHTSIKRRQKDGTVDCTMSTMCRTVQQVHGGRRPGRPAERLIQCTPQKQEKL